MENGLLVGKLNFGLGGVDIDIDRLGCNIEIDEERGLVVGGKHAGIGRQHGFLKIRVAHIPPVDKKVLLRIASGGLGLADKSANGNKVGIGAKIDKRSGVSTPRPLAKDTLDTLLLGA